ncbi:MAG: KpsF/GutQ family sugar-phosphate isomerase [Bacteroidales bacterium]|nr:KpsF/GutQ family sugar-phosphate isomerase [Bacteroidales bacterium]
MTGRQISKDELRKISLNVIENELEAIANLKNNINGDFLNAVELIYRSTGRVIITGIGKSAIIAGKIVATMNSTGTPAIFMHAADAIHGDLGIIRKEDVVICISNSGNTPEIKVLLPLLKMQNNTLIAFTGNMGSFLANHADYIINTTVPKEACPNNLTPTSSTTAQLVMGDALAICLLEYRGFTSEDFARFHPGGMIGKKLYLKVSDLYTQNQIPVVEVTDDIPTTIMEISSKRLGATAVMDKGRLAGIITDGDLRRMLEKSHDISIIKAGDIMSANPKTIPEDTLVVDAMEIMRNHNITQLLVTGDKGYVGVVHLHDILKEGIF